MDRLLFIWGLIGILNCIPISSNGQMKPNVDIQEKAFISKDTLNILITLIAQSPLRLPNHCGIYDSNVDIYPMFICYELEEFRNGKYSKFENSSYDLNSPVLFLTDTVNSKLFKCEKLIFSYKFKKHKKYRIRYYIHFERFNPECSMVVTEWSDLKFKNT